MRQVFRFLRQKSRGQRPRLVAYRLIQLSICPALTQRDTMALDNSESYSDLLTACCFQLCIDRIVDTGWTTAGIAPCFPSSTSSGCPLKAT